MSPIETSMLLALLLASLGDIALHWRSQRHPPRTIHTSLDAAVDANARVVAGLHEDIETLRVEIRNAAGLPDDQHIPQLLLALRITWAIVAVGGLLTLALIAILAWLIYELQRRGLLAMLGG